MSGRIHEYSDFLISYWFLKLFFIFPISVVSRPTAPFWGVTSAANDSWLRLRRAVDFRDHPSWLYERTDVSIHFDDNGVALTIPAADGRRPQTPSRTAEFMDQGHGDPPAARSGGVPDGDCPAVNVGNRAQLL
jgi:hypothetical protein